MSDHNTLLAEARALALYVSRHGGILATEHHGLLDDLLKSIAESEDDPSSANWQKLMTAYAQLTAVTYKQKGVNGRTILDTQAKPSGWSWLTMPKYRPAWIGAALFCIAMCLDASARYIGNISVPSDFVFGAFFYHLLVTFTTFLVPAVWGGIGVCVFLLKRLSDKLFELAYEKSRQCGAVTRIILGAMLGVIIVVVFYPDFDEQIRLGQINLAHRSAAFIAGLGVKPIYAAFETLTEELARRFRGNGGSK